MPSKFDHSQQAVFVYKPGNPHVPMRDAYVRNRLSLSCVHETEPSLKSQRVSKYLEAREIIENEAHSLKETYFDQTLGALSSFVKEAKSFEKLPTTILLRADVSSYISKIKELEPIFHIISLHSKECPNIKSTIKLIVNRFTEKNPEVVSDRRLTYDFHVLIDWLAAISADVSKERLLVVVEDADGFDMKIIRDLITHMHSYVANGELNLHLVLNLSVPLPLIEENLSQDNIVAMNVQTLQGLPPVTRFIDACQAVLRDKLGLMLSRTLIDKLFVVDVLQAEKYLKYATLGHFAGNPFASANSVADLAPMADAFTRLPSVHAKSSYDPDFVAKFLCCRLSMYEVAGMIPELQVGGNVLDVAFDPNYRPLLEQTLTDPRFYIDQQKEIDRMSVPATVLYQLTRESSIYINIYDFWMAFKEMLRPVPQCKDWDRQSMAIFLETITSFKMMGILRDCKRKFECVEKVSWKGV